jgi:hypothetical protein
LTFDGVGDPGSGGAAGLERVPGKGEGEGERDGKERSGVWYFNGDGRVWEMRVVL